MCIAMSLDWESTTPTEIINCNIIVNEKPIFIDSFVSLVKGYVCLPRVVFYLRDNISVNN